MSASSPKKKLSASKPSAKRVRIAPLGACSWSDQHLVDIATEYAQLMVKSDRLTPHDYISFVLGFVHGARYTSK